MPVAVTRKVSPALARCELTHLARDPIDINLAGEQHRRYEELLVELGCNLMTLPAAPELPDSVFVEDTALVLDELAVILRPGAESRRPETEPISELLSRFRPIARIVPPGTLDGGDVLRLDRQILVGRSGRSNRSGIEQLSALVDPLGYSVRGVSISGCLHLKSAVTQVAVKTVLLNAQWVDPALFTGYSAIRTHEEEPFAANALLLAGTLVYPAAFPHTLSLLRQNGLHVRTLDVSELGKAEGGMTCCSLILSP